MRLFDASGAQVQSFAPEVEARAVLEGQMLSMRLYDTFVLAMCWPCADHVLSRPCAEPTMCRPCADRVLAMC